MVAMTPDMYIFEQKQPVRDVLDYLHHLILYMDSDIRCSTKWGILYYEKHQHLLYLNPLKKLSSAVEVCFVRARIFDESQHLLDFKNRKIVGGYVVKNLEGVNEGYIFPECNKTILTVVLWVLLL